jgi:hypothetical protein
MADSKADDGKRWQTIAAAIAALIASGTIRRQAASMRRRHPQFRRTAL